MKEERKETRESQENLVSPVSASQDQKLSMLPQLIVSTSLLPFFLMVAGVKIILCETVICASTLSVLISTF